MKKDKDFVRKPIDVVSTVLNYIIAFIAVPFITLCACFLDVTGDNAHVINKALYFVPALTVATLLRIVTDTVSIMIWDFYRGNVETESLFML